MILQLKILGILFIILGLSHGIFPKYFKWKEDLKPLSLINRQIMGVHTFFISLLLVLIGVGCYSNGQDLVETSLGNQLCLALSIFFGARLLIQLFWFSPKLWRGKVFETTMHIIFTIFWTYVTWLFLNAAQLL